MKKIKKINIHIHEVKSHLNAIFGSVFHFKAIFISLQQCGSQLVAHLASILLWSATRAFGRLPRHFYSDFVVICCAFFGWDKVCLQTTHALPTKSQTLHRNRYLHVIILFIKYVPYLFRMPIIIEWRPMADVFCLICFIR